ncbi:alpha/beta fold hydrolase [Natronobiforma cellulositropha]|uniref:alpha/beta fold hydrolase n=1 Tax=Natronobiforma cellulositropha TaxID=1679076 RepID=UPI0021D5FE0B|nr:alpha/beta hydrolase [Natronobiforma cellulositropha]
MRQSTPTETGWLAGRHPYVRVGDGPKSLLVISGLSDAMFDGSYGRLDAAMVRYSFRRFLEEYTVYVVSRPRGLPDGTTIGELAEDYARLIETEDRLERPSVLGISMGGMIALELSRREPALVDRLVLGVSGCRVAETSVQTLRRYRWYALEHDWLTLRSELLREMHTGYRRRLYPTLSTTVGRLRPPTPADGRDVVVSIDAVLEYDASDDLAAVEPRTLVIGGDEDPFFPEAILRETHEGLPDAQLAMFTGARHGAFLERKEGFDNWVRQFLAGEPARIPQR